MRTQPRPREHGLDHDDTAEQATELEPHHGDHRNEGIAQGMLQDDHALAEALGPRRPHVILLQRLHERRADQPDDHRHAAHGHGQRGKHQVERAVVAGDGQQVGLEADVDHQHQADPE